MSYRSPHLCTNVDKHVPRRIKVCSYDYSIMQTYDKASIPLFVTRNNDICMLNFRVLRHFNPFIGLTFATFSPTRSHNIHTR